MRILNLPLAILLAAATTSLAADGNRLTYLDENNPYYPHLNFPKLITPQWVGEEGVEAVVILAIDDMRDPAKYEAYLRPILNRLKQIDGRAPVSIMTCNVKPDDPQLKQWLDEGLNFDVHTIDHPCPLLSGGDFAKAKSTYDRCVDLLHEIPGNKPVAFRMPCCDSLNTVSPRFYAEIFNKTTPKGNFLSISSSVFNIFTSDDPAIPRELVVDADGQDKFLKYLPKNLKRGDATFNTFVNTIRNYPYPYVINRLCWEFPCVSPSDWSAQHFQKPYNPDTVRDLKAALDITVVKQGVYCLVFHPHGWIKNDQVVDLIDHAIAKHGKKVKFLNFREALERLNKNVMPIDRHSKVAYSLRPAIGKNSQTALLDLNADGFQDVVVSGDFAKQTMLWDSSAKKWSELYDPMTIARSVSKELKDVKFDTMERFGILTNSKLPCVVHGSAWDLSSTQFAREFWEPSTEIKLLAKRISRDDISEKGIDILLFGGTVRLRDIDSNGICEVILTKANTHLLMQWSPEKKEWTKLPFELPSGAMLVDDKGRDAGLRFVDIDEDGRDDIVFSNAERYGIWLFADMQTGWSRKVLDAKRDETSKNDPASGRGQPSGSVVSRLTLPPIVRADGSDNGFFVHSRHLFWQNEDTDKLLDLVDRRSFNELLAQADLPPQPKSPEGAMKSFQVRPGFQIELMAAEPLTMDPVAFEWGPDGKLWVAEMADYPLGIDGKGTPGGRVRFLEDTDGDGKYDKSTLFLDGLKFPNGVMPWRNGVLISAAPDIIFAADTDGDGKADVREVLYTGFTEGNQQHRVNGFSYGLDNWIYLANGDSGGTIKYVGPKVVAGLPTEPQAPTAGLQKRAGDLRSDDRRGQETRAEQRAIGTPVSISGRDLRIRPETGEVEAVAGQTQFGRNRDDWGNWFGSNNSNPMFQFVLDDHYQRRNPHFPSPGGKVDVPKVAGNAPVFPISQTLARFNDFHTANRFTSACSAIMYRDDLFGAQFSNSMFVSEPVHNLVHREVVHSSGVTFYSERAPDEQQSEFLASSDNWFRPTMIKTGPDGALWIADMYRHVIEHPQWIPDTWQKRLDLRAGHDKGRIYRVYPVGVKPREFKRLDKLTDVELVAAFDSPSGWQRDTAQRLLIDRLCSPTMPANSDNEFLSKKSGVSEIYELVIQFELWSQVHKGKNAHARLHSLCTLDGIDRYDNSALSVPELTKAIADVHPAVRRLAVRLSPRLAHPADSRPVVLTAKNWKEPLLQALLNCVSDTDAQVRLQLAYTLGEIDDPRAGRTLGELLAKSGSDRFLFAAAMSSINKTNVEQVLVGVLANRGSGTPNLNLVEGLLNLAAAFGNDQALVTLLTDVATPREGKFETWQFAAVGGLLDTLDRQNKPLAKLSQSPDAALRGAVDKLRAVFSAARSIIGSTDAGEEARVAAIRLLGRGLENRDADVASLGTFLSPQTAPDLQEAAVAALGRLNEPRVAGLLIDNWRGFGPSRRTQALDLLLSRDAWQEQLLAALEKQTIATTDLDAARRQRLTQNRSETIRRAAAKLFADTGNADRQKVIDQYRPALELSGNPTRGAQLFAKTCAQCHKLKETGYEVGPDLASLTDKSPESLLVAILDPNRAVETKFLSYSAITKAGLTFNGLLAAETGNSITLRAPEAKEQTILRADLDELVSTSKSTMPEGLEKDLQPQDVADIIAHVRANVPLPVRKDFAGNNPTLIKPAADASLLLTAAACEIYGSTLVYEKQYGNLGYWSSLDDFALWTIDVTKPGKYTVEFDYACDRSVAENNTWRLDAGKNSLTGKVPSTGNWETYKKATFGEIELAAGKQQLTMRATRKIQGAMIDLRAIKLTPSK